MTKGNIIILGAGYGGIRVAQQLSKLLKNRQDFKIILVNKDYYHTLMTQLYEPAVGTKACSDVVIPLSEILEGSNISLVKGTVSLINLKARSIVINDTSEIPFQYLVIALGSMPEYFGIEGLKENSMSLSSFDHACDINNRINEILLKHKGNGEKPLNFVVGGGGLTGVEFTGELASYLEEKRQEYNLSKDQYKIIIIEAANQLLPGMSEETANYAKETLEKLGVEVIISDLISRVVPGSLHLKSGRDIEFSLLIWAGGIRGSSVLAQSGIKTDNRGRLLVNDYLQYVDDPTIYAVGDSALVKDPETGNPVLPTAQAAMQAGKKVAQNIYADITGEDVKVYKPSLILLCISVGRGRGLGESKKFRIKGMTAALLKKMIPLKYYFALGGLKLLGRRGIK
ncbi:FAD-dependent pyridine nucleotide-disulfide oxidoreductase [Desulforamulus reducens MI-1]|uniref:FAD-dependent pyridine nucleotide-disulfide oxidoreductase n=1 Tax=Desulforamulus reducens (strain ATCC BAA-1160 / DSM 100696 / MI-1) TaxID=349161 RepID=A4J1M7_DESRM|nr:NAD(P)/FAD-dependent oxidoreductase [Desulforamulus reducens]ABO48980.1 FAD-dependent pyridine nucleotide-disulfide oxidoreductase [Desulforamulus reducens MI-1]